MERFRGKKVLIVGLGKTGFSLIGFFNRLECSLRVTDIRPIFDLNKAVKRLKRVSPAPQMTFGEHKEEEFIEADVIVYGASVDPFLPQLEMARRHGREVYSEFGLAYKLCRRPLIAICGSFGRSSIAHMVSYTLKLEGKSSFVCGTSEVPFIEHLMQPDQDQLDYVVVEASGKQLQSVPDFHPKLVVYPNISDRFPEDRFRSVGDFIETKLSVIKNLSLDDFLIVNFDSLSNNTFFRNANCHTFWYSRRSFVKLGVVNEVEGTHFHEKRIHSNIHYHSEFRVSKMRIVGQNNRENLLAAITALKALKVSDKSIQTCIEKFPGIAHRLEFVMEKNGVKFYNDSKSEDMDGLVKSVASFKDPVILIAGGKDSEEDYDQYNQQIADQVRVTVLVGECKERLNRGLGDLAQTFLVGSFEEAVLIAYQKSRTGDVILLSPGNPSTDVFRDHEERGNYFKKMVYQL